MNHALLDLVFIELNPIELNYYPFMISLDKCNGSCNVLFPRICVVRKKKTNFKVFDMIINKNEAKAMAKHIPGDCKCKFNS